jgi:hypothetical protein
VGSGEGETEITEGVTTGLGVNVGSYIISASDSDNTTVGEGVEVVVPAQAVVQIQIKINSRFIE